MQNKDKYLCYGCGACSNVCPKNCIIMKPDDEGFLYPSIDITICDDCGLCKNVCPALSKFEITDTFSCYAASHRDKQEKETSSSGGVFSSLSHNVLERGGVVFGAAFNEKWEVNHIYIERLDDLDMLKRSKYVQSDIGFSYRAVRDFLLSGREVLFVGTPCQAAGLKAFLGYTHQNLICIDLICHSVSSPEVWKKFIVENFNIHEIEKINFREKHFGWDNSYLNFYLKSGLSVPYKLSKPMLIFQKILKRCKLMRLPKSLIKLIFYNSFLKTFLADLSCRPSCQKCIFKANNRASDITLGDLWGVSKFIPQMYDYLGVSAVIINSSKGERLFEQTKPVLSCSVIPKEMIFAYNSPSVRSVFPHPRRGEFFVRYKKESLNKLVDKLLDSEWKIFIKKIKRKLNIN